MKTDNSTLTPTEFKMWINGFFAAKGDTVFTSKDITLILQKVDLISEPTIPYMPVPLFPNTSHPTIPYPGPMCPYPGPDYGIPVITCSTTTDITKEIQLV